MDWPFDGVDVVVHAPRHIAPFTFGVEDAFGDHVVRSGWRVRAAPVAFNEDYAGLLHRASHVRRGPVEIAVRHAGVVDRTDGWPADMPFDDDHLGDGDGGDGGTRATIAETEADDHNEDDKDSGDGDSGDGDSEGERDGAGPSQSTVAASTTPAAPEPGGGGALGAGAGPLATDEAGNDEAEDIVGPPGALATMMEIEEEGEKHGVHFGRSGRGYTPRLKAMPDTNYKNLPDADRLRLYLALVKMRGQLKGESASRAYNYVKAVKGTLTPEQQREVGGWLSAFFS
jgi:hypothetical protein